MDFPRIEIHNFLGHPCLSDERIKGLSKRDLIVLSNRYIDDLDGVAKIKKINPDAKVLIYFIAQMINFGDVHPLTNDVENEVFKDKGPWWLTFVGTELAEDIGPKDEMIKVNNETPLDDAQGVRLNVKYGGSHMDGGMGEGKIFVQGDVLVCDDELMILMGLFKGKIVVKRGYLGTKPSSHKRGTRIAPVVRPSWAREEEYYGLGMSDTLNLNMTDLAPLIDRTRPNLYKADLFAETYYENERWRSLFDGVFWDCAGPPSGIIRTRRVDLDGDNKPDDWRTVWSLNCEGLTTFFKRLREKTGDFIHVGNGLHAVETWDIHKYANGVQQEAFIANDPLLERGYRIWENEMATYRAWIRDSDQPTVVWNTVQPAVWNDFKTFRFGLCSTLLDDGYYQYRMYTGDCYNYKYWYDEYWVDGEGKPSDNSRYRGWLGKPLGKAVQIMKPLKTPSLLTTSGWSLQTLEEYAKATITTAKDYVNIKVGSLKIRYADTVTSRRKIDSPLKPKTDYTMSFSAKASSPRLIKFDVLDSQGKSGNCKISFRTFVDVDWEPHVISVRNLSEKAEADATARFQLGLEEGEVWLKDIKLQEGLMEVGWEREFKNGLVLVNPTFQQQVFNDLGDAAYRRIKGKQDAIHNNGENVIRKLTVPPRDGFVLVRNR